MAFVAFSTTTGLVALPAVAQKGSATSKARDRSAADEAADAEALKAREERDTRAPEVVEEKAREKVETATQPGLTYEEFGRRQIELKVAEKRSELIAYLDQILSQSPPESERPELLFQKAELFLEEGQFHFFEGMGLDDDIYAAKEAGDAKKAKSLEQKKNAELKKSREWVRDAVLIFEEIEETYPDFERMPEVLYALGRAFWDVQSYKKALPVYRKIIQKYPKSQYVADAWLAFGEYYFEYADDKNRDLKKALNAYKESAKFEDSPVFGYAVYKQGWCYYNLSQFERAGEKFKEVILYSDINSDLLGERRITLAREARKDFVLTYSNYGGAQKAPKEFEEIAKDKEEQRKMLERLADIYYGNGQDREAIIAYRILMKQQPDNTRNPLFQSKIVKLASRIGEKRQVVAQTRELNKEYTRVRGVFAKLNPGDKNYETVKEDLAAADDVADNTLRYLATTWHNEAKKTRDDSTFQYAYELYGDYLQLFSDRKEAYEIRFFYAELLFKLEKFQKAGEEYIKVFTQKPDGKWAQVSATEAVRSYEEVVSDYDRENKRPPVTGADALKPRPLPDIKKQYIGACNNYIEHYPEGEIVVEAKYKVARTLYDYNYFDDSTARFMEIIDKHPTHGRAVQSANLILDTYNILEDWQKLHDAARKFAGMRELLKEEEFKTVLLQVLEESSFKLINDYEKRKEFEEAGKRYLAFADEFPKSSLADKALANAAAMFTRAGQLDRAIKVRIKLVNTYAESPLVPDQIYAVATAMEQVVDYKRAAEWLEKFVDKYPTDPRSQDALFNAAIYREGVGQTKKAVEDRELYIKRYGKSKDLVDVAFSIPVSWDRANNSREAVKTYLEFADKWFKQAPDKALIAQYRAVRLLESRRSTKGQANKELGKLEAMAKRYKSMKKPIEDAGEALGYLSFQEANDIFEDFKKLKIAKPDNPNQFRKTLTAKQKAKGKVDDAYTTVVKIKNPEWAVASLYQLGMVNQELVSAIAAVPPPRGLTAEQEQLFKDKLSEQTLPLEEEASKAMVLCLDESARFGVFNDWTRKCLAFLETRRPDTYPKNDLEVVADVEVSARPPEQGKGLVLTLPKHGERAVAEQGTEPPIAKISDKKMSVVGKPQEKSSDDFEFSEGEI